MSEDQIVNQATEKLNLEPSDPRRLATLCGPIDRNIRQLERRLGIAIRNRGNEFQVKGPTERVQAGCALLTQLYMETEDVQSLEPSTIHLYLQQSGIELLTESPNANGEITLVQTRRRSVRPRGRNQISFVENLRSNDVTFGIGPAGTGKTYLAVACAVEALEQDKVSRILLVRPAVEVGEKLGFLPGDLAQKIDPYLRPLYDALYEMLGAERVNKLIERNVIEIAPLAYMRGRTLNGSFIILDEAQNTTRAQMKMFLTRIGFGSTVAITGDITQIDLPQNASQSSGLKHILKILPNVSGLSVTRFNASDVVRHPIVQSIVEAYAKDEESSL